MTYEISKMLTLSTGHLTEEVCNVYLADTAEGFAYPKGEWGCFVYTATDDDGLPSLRPRSLDECLAFAKSVDCDWVMFDCDGPIIPELTCYEW